jgi:predicted CopG family antitoxin
MTELKMISDLWVNYQALKSFGKAGDSFNDVITNLIRRAGTLDGSLENKEKLQPYNSRPKQSKAVVKPTETVS